MPSYAPNIVLVNVTGVGDLTSQLVHFSKVIGAKPSEFTVLLINKRPKDVVLADYQGKAATISIDGVVAYRPETTCDVHAGDMLAAGFGYGMIPPQAWDFRPSFSSPSLVPDDPSRVWCWFRAVNRHTDFLILNVWGTEDERAVRWRLWRKGYSVIERHANGNDIRLHVAPPSGWSVLEGWLAVRQWKEVDDAHFPVVVY